MWDEPEPGRDENPLSISETGMVPANWNYALFIKHRPLDQWSVELQGQNPRKKPVWKSMVTGPIFVRLNLFSRAIVLYRFLMFYQPQFTPTSVGFLLTVNKRLSDRNRWGRIRISLSEDILARGSENRSTICINKLTRATNTAHAQLDFPVSRRN